jgi:hypothetical protein
LENKKAGGPQILFLNFALKKDAATGEFTVRLLNKIISTGQLKNTAAASYTAKPGDLTCSTLDAELNPLNRIFIENPISRTVEFVDDAGQLAVKKIELDSTEFVVRMQLDPKTAWIAIDQFSTDDAPAIRLLRTKLE